MLAQNLAICWKLFEKYKYFLQTQSAGNYIIFNVRPKSEVKISKINFILDKLHRILRDYTLKIINNFGILYKYIHFIELNFCMSPNITTVGIKKQYISTFTNKQTDIKNTHTIIPRDIYLSSYLAGLIEGDGCIYLSKNDINTPQIIITFTNKDYPLLATLQKIFNIGNIYKIKGKNAYHYRISDKKGLEKIVNLINGYMRTPKNYQFNKLIEWLNKKNINIIKKPLDTSPLDSNAWLAGFIEGDGHFSVRLSIDKKGKLTKTACSLELVQRQKDIYGISYFEIMFEISKFLLCNVKEINITSKNPQYRLRTTNLKGNLILENYLNTFPLFGSKYLDYKDWSKILEFFYIQKKKNEDDIKKILKIKSNMNNNRTYFNWDHLQKINKI